MGIFLFSAASKPGGSFPEIKRTGRVADHSPPLVPRLRMRGAIPPLPNTSSWRGAWLKHRDNFTSKCTHQVRIKSSFS
jgi:hypothetical protein